MSFDFTRILESKQLMRTELSKKSIEEKFAMLDALRDRALTLRESGAAIPCALKDEPRWYRQK